jgi:LysM domain
MKTTIFRSSWLVILIAGALVAPAVLPAQRADSTRTHVVKAGDTFWNLAATYLGDGNRWREILEINPAIKATNALSVGLTIRIPASGAKSPSPAPTSRPATPPPAAQPAPARPIVNPAPKESIPASQRTIFYGAQPGGGFAPSSTLKKTPPARVVPSRVFEAMSAPFVTEHLALEVGGRCVSVGAVQAADAGGVLLQGVLSVQLPAGWPADTGSRWLLVRQGPLLTNLGVVAIPTGVIRLTSTGAHGAGASAEIVAQFDAMSCTDVVLPAPVTSMAPTTGRLTTVTDGARGHVAWIAGESLLPTLQFALILDMGAASGVRVGDRVTIYAENGTAVVATADVVRVDSRSSTALVVRQSSGTLATGLAARVTEKLP